MLECRSPRRWQKLGDLNCGHLLLSPPPVRLSRKLDPKQSTQDLNPGILVGDVGSCGALCLLSRWLASPVSSAIHQLLYSEANPRHQMVSICNEPTSARYPGLLDGSPSV